MVQNADKGKHPLHTALQITQAIRTSQSIADRLDRKMQS